MNHEPETVRGELVPAAEPVLRGRFSLYAEDGKPLVFALRLEGSEEDRHFVVPKMLEGLLSRQTGVNVRDMLRAAASEGEPPIEEG